MRYAIAFPLIDIFLCHLNYAYFFHRMIEKLPIHRHCNEIMCKKHFHIVALATVDLQHTEKRCEIRKNAQNAKKKKLQYEENRLIRIKRRYECKRNVQNDQNYHKIKPQGKGR